MKPQFRPRQRREPQETRPAAGAVRRSTSALRSFRSMPPPLLSPLQLLKYDPLGAELRLSWRDNRVRPTSHRCLASPLFLGRPSEDRQRYRPKRSAPNREEWFLKLAKLQNCGALRLQLTPSQSFPFSQD